MNFGLKDKQIVRARPTTLKPAWASGRRDFSSTQELMRRINLLVKKNHLKFYLGIGSAVKAIQQLVPVSNIDINIKLVLYAILTRSFTAFAR